MKERNQLVSKRNDRAPAPLWTTPAGIRSIRCEDGLHVGFPVGCTNNSGTCHCSCHAGVPGETIDP